MKKRAGETLAATACTIILTPEEAQIVKPYYLGMLDGPVILFDRQQFFARILERLRERLEELGTERRTDPDSYTYWVLKEMRDRGSLSFFEPHPPRPSRISQGSTGRTHHPLTPRASWPRISRMTSSILSRGTVTWPKRALSHALRSDTSP